MAIAAMLAERRHVPIVILSYVGMAASLVALGFGSGAFGMTGLIAAFAGAFVIGAQLLLYGLAPLYYPTAIRGTGVGAAVGAGRLGAVVGPLLAGVLFTGLGGGAVLKAMVPVVVVAGVLATWLVLSRRAQGEEDPSLALGR
jgi:AAHS family 3-hydroxyphenylpropionic acid transporter